MKKSFVIICVFVFTLLCVGCANSNNKILRCESSGSFGSKTSIVLENGTFTSTVETTYDTEEKAKKAVEEEKRDNPNAEVTRNGSKVIVKETEKSNYSYEEIKNLYETAGYTCE